MQKNDTPSRSTKLRILSQVISLTHVLAVLIGAITPLNNTEGYTADLGSEPISHRSVDININIFVNRR